MVSPVPAPGVAGFAVTNHGDEPAQAAFALRFTAGAESSTPAGVRLVNGVALVEKNDKLLAPVRFDDAEGLVVAENGVLRVTGPARQTIARGFTVY